jgi:DNA polymerase I-like protein with 3'-5' exonuclease and polymerase domains
MWGGTMTENEIQGTGMDILKHAVNELKESELRYWLLDSHDELVFCLPKSDYKDMADEILKKMTNVPWLPDDFPLEADADFVDMYQKT